MGKSLGLSSEHGRRDCSKKEVLEKRAKSPFSRKLIYPNEREFFFAISLFQCTQLLGEEEEGAVFSRPLSG